MLKLLLFCILLVLCWPIALAALVLYPLIWLILLPFRLVGIVVGRHLRTHHRHLHAPRQSPARHLALISANSARLCVLCVRPSPVNLRTPANHHPAPHNESESAPPSTGIASSGRSHSRSTL